MVVIGIFTPHLHERRAEKHVRKESSKTNPGEIDLLLRRKCP
jgi:hypothetical protein